MYKKRHLLQLKLKDKENICIHIISVIVITVFSLLIGSKVYRGNRVLYLDDLSTWELFSDPDITVIQKIFNTEANKTRFVLNIFLFILFKIVGSKYERIDILLQAENIVIGICFYYLCVAIASTRKKEIKDKKETCISVVLTLMFMASRFSYYSYSEILGIMENVAMLCAILFVFSLLKDDFKVGRNYWIANFIYVIAIFTHERYFVLAGVLISYLVMCMIINRKHLFYSKKAIAVAFILALMLPVIFFGIRFLFVGNRLLDGTGGTDIKSTFSILFFLKQCLYQILYLIGINCPNNAYLNGVDPRAVPFVIYILELFFLIVYIWTLVSFLQTKEIKVKKSKYIFKLFLFYLSIGALIVSSSVTIRIEMRWLYVSYALFLLSFMYMVTNLLTEYRTQLYTICILLSATGILIGESYYRGCWNNLYYWGTRELSASLIEVLGADAQDIDNLVIVEDPSSPGLDEESIIKICSTYDIKIEKVTKVTNIYDRSSEGQTLLKPAGINEYTELSPYVSNIYNISGWYEDGWIEPDTSIRIVNLDSDELNMTVHYPSDVLSAQIQPKVSVYNNGIFVADFIFTNEEKNFNLKIEDLPLGINTIEILSDFYCIENSGRSEQGQLSCLLTQININ